MVKLNSFCYINNLFVKTYALLHIILTNLFKKGVILSSLRGRGGWIRVKKELNL